MPLINTLGQQPLGLRFDLALQRPLQLEPSLRKEAVTT